MRHRATDAGYFFLTKRADGEEFTDEDDEVLMLFASQAPAAIANAPTHRSEQRARSDLETLLETSAVGVVVLDAGSARTLSTNCEASGSSRACECRAALSNGSWRSSPSGEPSTARFP